MRILKLFVFSFLFSPVIVFAQSVQQANVVLPAHITEWILSDLLSAQSVGIRITGKPKPVKCKYGQALQFNGSTDGIFLDEMPLEGLGKFTIEIIMCPYSGGNFEQRFFHCGEVKGSRVLLELRSTPTGWYLDGFIKSGDQQKTLIEPSLMHPSDQWAHIAFVVDRGKQETWVNGKKELESQIELLPLHGGKTSVGVRQNEQSWFEGAIFKIRISPETLNPGQFLKY